METEALSKSWIGELIQYTRSRLVRFRMLALVALLLTATWIASAPDSLGTAVRDLVLAAFLLIPFRLWDDLADIDRDRTRDPTRVLTRSTRTGRYRILAGSFAAIHVVLVAWTRSGLALICLLGIHLVLLVWYAVPRRREWEIVNYHVVLLKYPAFVFVLAHRSDSAQQAGILVAGIVAYLILCIHEVWHDTRLRREDLPRRIAGAQIVILTLALILVGLIAVHAAGRPVLGP